MKSKLTKVLLASSLALACLTPALASNTTITITAEIEEVLVLQIENTNNEIASGDDLDPQPGSPVADDIIDFDVVDPYAINAGSFSSANNINHTGTFDKQLYSDVNGPTQFYDEGTTSNTIAGSDADGAVYFIQDGYQLRALRTGALPTEVDVGVDGTTPLPALVALSGVNDYSDGSDVHGMVSPDIVPIDTDPGPGVTLEYPPGSEPYQNPGYSYAYTNLLDVDDSDPVNPTGGLAHNVPQHIDIGIFVPVTHAAGDTSTTITFYGT
jgi:hypothetical protein